MSSDRFTPSTALSRRRLLQGAALAASALPAGAWSGNRADADGPDPAPAYQDAFRRALAADRNVRAYSEPGREFLYRPGQLLVAHGDTARVQRWLRSAGIAFRVGKPIAGVTRLLLNRQADIPAIVARLRDPRRWPGGRVPAVQPHHVTVGYGNIMGNPGGPPTAADAVPGPDAGRRGDGKGVTVGVCDTGIWQYAGSVHAPWFLGAYADTVDDRDPLYLHDDVLAWQAGHGTFVAGVLRQSAPGVRFDPEPALSDLGIGDEEMLVAAINRLDRRTSIVNLSLGCYTQDDVPPLPIVKRLGALGRDVAVVAAAGNAGLSRPAWPAALPKVLAVAAVSTDVRGTTGPAGYSNYGPWVNACAEGTRTGAYVTGRLELPGLAATTFTGYAKWAGTSFAAPHVAGALATLMTTNGHTAAQASKALLAGPQFTAGFGVLVE